MHSAKAMSPSSDDIGRQNEAQQQPQSTEDDWAAFDSHFALAPRFTPRHRSSSSTAPSSSMSRSSSLSASHPRATLTIVDLPEDVFFHVFDYLSTLSLLRLSCRPPSRSFQRLLRSHSVFDLDLDREMIDSPPPASASQHASRSLLASKEHYTPLIPLALHSFNLSLLTLASFGPLIADPLIQPILDRHSPTLLSLSLANNDLTNPSISSPSLTSLDLSRNRRLQLPVLLCPSLVQLDMSRTFINDLDLQKTCDALQRLRVLRLQSCKNIRTLPLHLPHLSILDLTNTAVVDEAVTRISQSPALTVLFVNECSTLRSPVITSSTLTVLSLRSCEALRSPVLTGCPALTELNLSDTPLTDAVLVSALSNLAELRVLSLRQCYQLTHPVLTQPLTELVSLDLTMSGIQTEGVQSFIDKARQLQTVQLAMCNKINEGLFARGGLDNLPFLCDVNLRSTSIGEEDVATLIRTAPLLSRLNLSTCMNVTTLPVLCSSLVHLDMSYCTLTDVGLSTVLHHASHLLTGHFDHCDGLINPNVSHPTLEELHLATCRGMDGLTVDCPSLTTLDLSSNHGLSSVTLSPATVSSLKLLVARHVQHYAISSLQEELAGKEVEVQTHTNAISDLAYHPLTQHAVRPARRAPSTPSRRATTPLSAASPSTSSTTSLHSPTPSPASALSTSSSDEPDHRRRTAPRPIERQREQKDDDASPLPLSPSPSSRTFHSGSPVKSRYLLFTSPKRSHRHTSTTLVTPSSSSSLHPPLTPPAPRSRLSRTLGTISSTPVSPASDGINDQPPPSPHVLSSSALESGIVVPSFSVQQLKRSASSSAVRTMTGSAPTALSTTLPFHLSPVPIPPLTSTSSSLSTLLQTRPIPRSALLSTSPVPTPAVCSVATSSSLLPPPSRLDCRASSLSSVDSLPRFYLNSIELYIMTSHINEIEARLKGRGGGAELSTASRYGLKRQMALLRARLKKEEKLVQEISQVSQRQGVQGEERSAGHGRKNST